MVARNIPIQLGSDRLARKNVQRGRRAPSRFRDARYVMVPARNSKTLPCECDDPSNGHTARNRDLKNGAVRHLHFPDATLRRSPAKERMMKAEVAASFSKIS